MFVPEKKKKKGLKSTSVESRMSLGKQFDLSLIYFILIWI